MPCGVCFVPAGSLDALEGALVEDDLGQILVVPDSLINPVAAITHDEVDSDENRFLL